MICFKNDRKKSTLSLKIIVVGILISNSLTEPSFAEEGVNPQYLDSWQNISRSLTAADEAEDRFIPGEWRLVDNYELLDVPVGESVSIYLKGNPNDDGSGLCDPLVSIYDVNEGSGSVVAFDENSGAGGAGDGYVGDTCGNSYEQRYDAFLTVPNWDSDYRIQVSSNGTLETETDRTLDTMNSGAYTLYVSVGNLPCYVVVGTVLTDDGTCTGAIVIDDTVTSIGNNAFAGLTGLTSVTIGNSVTSIGSSAFYGNTALTSVTIGNSVRTIGSDAFGGNTRLTSVTIPDSVITIGDDAFYGNTALTSVIIGNSVTSIGAYAFSGNTALTSVTIPDSVTSIGVSAFRDNSALTSVTIGNSVTRIGALAFLQTDLYSINIPDSVTSIGASAFEANLNLKEVRFLGNAPTVGADAFQDVAADATANIRKAATASFVSTPWNGLIVVVAQYESSWQVVSGSLTGDDSIGQRFTNGFADTLFDTYELLDVPEDADVSIYIKGNPNDDGTGLCDPALVIYDVTNPDPNSSNVKVYDGGLGGADAGYNGLTCARNGKLFDAFSKVSTAGENVSNFRIQVTSQGFYSGDLNDINSGAYTLYVNVGRAVLIGGPAGDSGSDSSPTTKTITPVAVKNADSITNMKNKTYISKHSMKLKLRENNLFKYSASDSFKYQVFKSSKKSCGMMGNYVMRYENSKTCDLYITRTNAKGISNKYWVKINYSK